MRTATECWQVRAASKRSWHANERYIAQVCARLSGRVPGMPLVRANERACRHGARAARLLARQRVGDDHDKALRRVARRRARHERELGQRRLQDVVAVAHEARVLHERVVLPPERYAGARMEGQLRARPRC